MVIQIVRFKSELTEEKLLAMSESRAPQYRALKGLQQKYYLRFPDTGEYGAVYLWESRAALDEFRSSELFRTIPAAYEVQGKPDVQIGELILTLREG